MTEPSAKMSAAGPTSRGRRNCSGAMNGGVPINFPVSVRSSLSFGREMPKSMTFGPSSASSTLLGFRSRCTTPTRWMSRSASASPAISRRSCSGAMGPFRFTWSERVGPGMNRGGHPGPFGLRIGIHHRRREGTADPARGGHLLPETAPELRVPRELGMDDLHRQPHSRGAPGEVYDPHATGAQTGLQPIVTGVLGKFRFRARSGVALWRHGPPPCSSSARARTEPSR